MTGPLRIQDSLRVEGDVHAKRLFGALPENSVGSDQLLDFSVSEPKLSFDLGIELSGSLLRESPEPFPGHRFTGAHIIVPAAGPPQMDSRGLRAVAIGQSIFVLDKQGSWLIHPHEHRTVQCPPVPKTFETFALAASSEEAFLFSGSDDLMTLVYEKSSASWRTSAPPPVPLIDAQAAYHHGLIYVVGGLKGPRIWRAASKRLLVFDPAQNSWWELAEMPTALAGAAFASEGAGLLLTGGYRPRFGGWLGIRRHRSSFYFHPSTEHWSQRSPVPDPNLGENLCSIGPDLVLPSKTGRPQVYRGSGGRWTTSDAFDARTGGCFVSTGTDLYRIERDREGHPSAVLLAKALFVFSIEK